MLPMETQDTIAAIATAHGEAGVGIIRVAGPQAPIIAQAFLNKKPTPRYAHFCHFDDASGGRIDSGLLLYFPQPHSFTGDDVLELQIHGSRITLDLLLRRVCALGARLARAGEFSERAFLNGKIDLVQAEAIADLIAADSEVSARSAMRSLQGAFSEKVHAVQDELTTLRVHIEAAIDFPEEEIDFLSDPAIEAHFERVRKAMHDLLQAAKRGVRLHNRLAVAIVGRPNTGKSSLLNRLVGDDRAIVTPTAGTTRDALREILDIDGIGLELVDTAGMRESDDAIEQEGVRRAQQHLMAADVALLVTRSEDRQADKALLAALPATTRRIIVCNKIDLEQHAAGIEQTDADDCTIWLSAKTGEGMALLQQQLKHLAGLDGTETGAFSARRRHILALEKAQEHVHTAQATLQESRAGELAAEDLRQAQQALGEVTGEFYPDDLLGAIFSSFCIGK